MLTRLLVILTLVWQPLILRGAVVPPTRSCEGMSCCEVVTRTTCCGQIEVVRLAPRNHDSCRCAVGPTDSSPRPAAPLPGSERQTVVFVGLPPISVASAAFENAKPSIGSSAPLGLHSDLTHNQIQAILGIWRT